MPNVDTSGTPGAPAAETVVGGGGAAGPTNVPTAVAGHTGVDVPVDPKAANVAAARDLEAFAISKRKLAKDAAEIRKTKDALSQQQRSIDEQKAALAEAKPELDLLAKAHGLTREEVYQRFTQQMLGGEVEPIKPTVESLRADLEAFKQQQLDAETKRQADAAANATKAEQDLLTRANAHAAKLVDDNADKYQFIKAEAASGAIVELIQLEAKNGNNITFEQAADRVEDFLEKKAMKWLEIPKFKAKVAPPPAAQTVKDLEEVAKKTATKGSTLTNRQASEPPARVPAKRMTEDQRMEAAISQIRVKQPAA